MSYDIAFKVKVEGVDAYIDLDATDANITWNLGTMIRKSTGLEWNNEANNGLCVDVIPKISAGLAELLNHPEKYQQYEGKNGWGTIHGCIRFFTEILNDWSEFCSFNPLLVPVATFWIQ